MITVFLMIKHILHGVKGAVQKVKLFQVELNQNVDLSRFLNKQKGHPKVENTTFWTAPYIF